MKRVAMLLFSHYLTDARPRREAEALLEAGFSVDVICLCGQEETVREEVNGINIYRVRLDHRGNDKLRYLWEYGYFLIASFFKLSKLHFFRRYSLIHVHNPPDILVLSALIPKLTGAKIVLDMHEIMPELYIRKFSVSEDDAIIMAIKCLEKFSAKLSDHIIVATPFLKKTLIKRAADPEKVTTIINLPDMKYFHKVKATFHHGPYFRLIYPGTLSELHGVDIAIKAIKLVTQETPIPLEFHIYGGGSAENYLKSLTRKLSLQETVHFYPSVPFLKLCDILHTMDIGIVPKRGGVFADEAISTKVFEFAAAGLPAIVARTKGDSLFFDDTMVCFFEPGNERDLANCIIKAYRDPLYLKTLSENSISLMEKMNWEILKKKFLKIFELLLPGK